MAAPAFERKIRAPASASDWAATLARPLVFTNGVFDILHRGHVTYLARARAFGASLVVALNHNAALDETQRQLDVFQRRLTAARAAPDCGTSLPAF